MRMGWGTLACGLIVGAAAGFVCGHVAAWTNASERPVTSVERPVRPDSIPVNRHSTLLLPAPASELNGPVFFPQHLHAETEIDEPVHADAELAANDVPKAEVSGHEPAALPEPAESGVPAGDKPADAPVEKPADAPVEKPA